MQSDNGSASPADAQRKLVFTHFFTKDGVHPFDEVKWVKRDAVIKSPSGEVKFELKDCLVPEFWSQKATNIVAEKYFRVVNGKKEQSAQDMILRVAKTISDAGREQKLFADLDSANIFELELTHILLHQMYAFNSPVWFNIGVPNVKQQASACFIQYVDDTMESITDLIRKEMLLFKGGSGTGSNLSNLRSSFERLSGGGHASGPVSFMEVLDSGAGVTKSGGTTRRAAKMVVMNADHPDILIQQNGRPGFITCKQEAEKMAHVLIDSGLYSGDFTKPGNAYEKVGFQNANNSVRVTDDFMKAVIEDKEWITKAVTTGQEVHKYRAKELWHKIAEAAHFCGDPGLQFDTTTNKWHTCKASGRINASNPCCFTGETLVDTSEGKLAIGKLAEMAAAGEELPHAFAWDRETRLPVLRRIKHAWKAGDAKRLVRVTTDKGLTFLCTPEHRFLTDSDEYVEAQHLMSGTQLRARSLQAMANDQVASIEHLTVAATPVFDIEVEGVNNFGVTLPGFEHSIIVHNSEYLFLDDTACNLGSINLLKFLKPSPDMAGRFDFDIGAFRKVAETTITAMEILVGYSSYPSETIAENSQLFRPLGLGYANLGALLMALGLPYDSDEGRKVAAAITAIMSGQAYAQSGRMAEAVGPFPKYKENEASFVDVMYMHERAAAELDDDGRYGDLVRAAKEDWQIATFFAQRSGYRNSQISVIAPTGTISFLMDCDTTGIEPMLDLIVTKKLVGGGEMKMPNGAVLPALKNLGYGEEEITRVEKLVQETGKLGGIKEEHRKVFQTAIGSDPVSVEGHLRMMSAVQPFLSGGISKTVNMVSTSTVEDVERAYMLSWELGLKCVAIYRDGCKRSQPATSSHKKEKKVITETQVDEMIKGGYLQEKAVGNVPPAEWIQAEAEGVPVRKWGERKRMPRDRDAYTHKFSIGGQEGYLTVGMHEDGTPGEVFLRMSQAGSTLNGLVDMAAMGISIALQHGAPLRTIIDKFKHMKFEPAGLTDNPAIRFSDSIADYVGKHLELKFFPSETANLPVAELPKALEQVKAEVQRATANISGPPCSSCGSLTVRCGSCWVCNNCGTTTGCG